MTALVTQRVHRLADSLAELKIRVRTALATELAGAVGTAIRDVLVVALIDRLVVTPTRSSTSPPRGAGWRADEYEERDRWGEPQDPWADPDDYETRVRPPARYEREERDEVESTPAVPTAAAVAVGLNVGRWWLARQGTVGAAVEFCT